MSAINDEYNCLQVYNNSEKIVTVFIYEGFSPLCKFPSLSKILEPEEDFLHYIKKPFMFEIIENKENETKKKHLGPEKCNGIRVIKVSDGENSLKCEQITVNEKDKKRIFFRMKNLYEQLGLDRKEVRNMDEDQRIKAIRKAFLKMILIWHPDKPNGDQEIAVMLIQARNTLLNNEMRAQYHNQIDFEQGWLSSGRWKAIFAPEIATHEQLRAYVKRLLFSGLSSLLIVGGIAVSVCTAGLAVPSLVMLGGIVGGELRRAGFPSLKETLSKEAVVYGIDGKKWVEKALKGGASSALCSGALNAGPVDYFDIVFSFL